MALLLLLLLTSISCFNVHHAEPQDAVSNKEDVEASATSERLGHHCPDVRCAGTERSFAGSPLMGAQSLARCSLTPDFLLFMDRDCVQSRHSTSREPCYFDAVTQPVFDSSNLGEPSGAVARRDNRPTV